MQLLVFFLFQFLLWYFCYFKMIVLLLEYFENVMVQQLINIYREGTGGAYMAGTNYAVEPSWLDSSGRSILGLITNLYLTHYSGFRSTPSVLEWEISRIFLGGFYWKKTHSWPLHEKGPHRFDHTNGVQNWVGGRTEIVWPALWGLF